MKAGCVLDASALLAWLFGEPGSAIVTEFLGKGSLMTTVNWLEVLQKTQQRGITVDQLKQDLTERNLINKALHILPFQETEAATAASFYQATSKLGLSLAARACLALGLMRNLPVLTADQVWESLDIGVAVGRIC